MGGYEFANPLMLWGALLAALPVLIHLFNRKRAKPHPFAAIDFVLRSRRRTASRLRLKRILLYAVRTLLLIAIPVALARPQPKRITAEAAKPTGPTATAIVLDTSLSMSFTDKGVTHLERAKKMARDAVAGLAIEDPVTLVTCEKDAPAPQAPGFDRAKVREGLDAAKPTAMPQDLTSCLGRAAQALGESPLPAKRIIVATDLTAPAFRLDVPAPTVKSAQGGADIKPEVVLLDAAEGAKELPNAAVTDLHVEPATAVGSRAYQFTLTVANHGSQPLKDLTAVVRVGTEVVAKGFVDVPPRGTASKALVYRFPAGGAYTGSVEIAHDGLALDDARHFSLKVPRDVRALVVNGAPQTVRFMDEAFFVETALTSPGSPVKPTLRDPETAVNEKLSEYDVVLLLNVRTLPQAKLTELAEFVKAGGGLFVSLGDQADPDRVNEELGTLLPRKLHLVKTAASRHGDNPDQKPARLVQVQWDHPALSVFVGDAREAILSSNFYKYFLLSPGDAAQVTQLAAFDDGAPALLEARRGKGRVILFTSSVDRDWNDWPIRPSFLPVMQRIAGWLAGTLDEREAKGTLVGDPRVLDVPPGTAELKLKGPDGKDVPVKATPDGKSVVEATFAPGLYLATGRVNGAQQALPDLSFAVNVDPRESDLTRIDEHELKAYFGEKTRTERGAGKDDAPPPLPTWSVLLACAVALFFFEGLLVRR